MPNVEKDAILLKAQDISRPLISVDDTKTLLDIRTVLLRYNISRVAVSSEGGSVVGIITEKDISKFLYLNASDRRRLSEIPVRDLLQNRNELIAVPQESTLYFCAKSMLNNNISSIFLINNEGKIEEIITKTDLVEVFAYHYSGYFSVEDCMTKKVITAEPDENIHVLPILMNAFNVSRIVVVKHNHPVGIVTLRDFLPPSTLYTSDFFDGGDGGQKSNIPKDFTTKLIPAITRSFLVVQDIMNTKLLLMDKDDDMAESAKVMVRHAISGMPVIDNEKNLIGVITKTDILKAILKIPVQNN